ncbi:MAG: PKD domain-containing protein, partial [Bacteroidetes bacterium]|nr:PKD domain-containing protein [Bacteroidota bacterium]
MKSIIFSLGFFISYLCAGQRGTAQQTSYQEMFILGGMNGDIGVVETSDGGFVTTGQSETGSSGGCDIYVFKKDLCGKLVWFKNYGGGGNDGGTSIQRTSDGGYIVGGLYADYDAVLLKIDANGNQQWFKTYGGGGDDRSIYAIQTSDGGYIFAGHCTSFGAGGWDAYVVKTDNAGVMQWEKTYGGGGTDFSSYIEPTSDGGYIVSGSTTSFGSGGYDLWLIKIDATGNVMWSKVYGGASDDGGDWNTRAPVTADGGFILTSYSASYSNGGRDIFFVKTDNAGNLVWAKSYGGGADEESRFGYPLNNGNIVSTGYMRSFGFGGMDYYLLLTDSAGNLIWCRTYGSSGDEKAMSVQQSSDGGFVLCGNTNSFGANYYDIYFIKTDSAGMTTCNTNTVTPTVTVSVPAVSSVTPTVTSPTAEAAPVITVNNLYPALTRLCIQCYFEAKYTYCKNQLQLTMYDSSACIPTNWYWDFGDGYTTTGQNPSHVYTTPGTYFVRLVAADSTTFCVDTVLTSITVDLVPVSQFTFTNNVCYGTPTQFFDLSNGSINSWYWDFGDGTYDTIQNPVHLYSVPGTYNAELKVVYDGFCTDSLTIPVYVRPIPVADFSSQNVCLNVPTSFTNLSAVSSGAIAANLWNFGDGTGTSSQPNPSYVYSSPNFYSTTLIVTSDYGCKDTIIKTYEVFPLPTASFSATEVCLGYNTVFTDASAILGDTIVNWYWDFGDGFTDVSQNTQHLYSNFGTYFVELKVVTDEGCADSTSPLIPVIVDPLPIANFTVNPVCESDSAIFSNTSTVITGTVIGSLWYFGDGDSSLLTNPAHLYSDGTWNVTLGVISDKGCFDTVIKTLIIYPLPLPYFGFASVCAQDTVFFSDSSVVSSGFLTTWIWDFGDGSVNSYQQNPGHIYLDPDTYTVELIVYS